MHIRSKKMKQLCSPPLCRLKIYQQIHWKNCAEHALTINSPLKASLHPWEGPESNWHIAPVNYRNAPEYIFLLWIQGFSDVGLLLLDNAVILIGKTFNGFVKKKEYFKSSWHQVLQQPMGYLRNIPTVKHRLLSTMTEEPYMMKQILREMLFVYWTTHLANGKTPSELYHNRQIQIKLYALKHQIYKTFYRPL